MLLFFIKTFLVGLVLNTYIYFCRYMLNDIATYCQTIHMQLKHECIYNERKSKGRDKQLVGRFRGENGQVLARLLLG